MNGNVQDLRGNNMIKKLVRGEEVIRLMDGQEHVHYLLQQRYISLRIYTLPTYHNYQKDTCLTCRPKRPSSFISQTSKKLLSCQILMLIFYYLFLVVCDAGLLRKFKGCSRCIFFLSNRNIALIHREYFCVINATSKPRH